MTQKKKTYYTKDEFTQVCYVEFCVMKNLNNQQSKISLISVEWRLLCVFPVWPTLKVFLPFTNYLSLTTRIIWYHNKCRY